MKREPPKGTKIEIERKAGSTTYRWSNKEKKLDLPKVFLMTWLAGWTIGGITVLSILISGSLDAEDKSFFWKWILGWAAGEVIAICFLYVLLKPLKPSVLILYEGSLHFETGTRPSVTTHLEKHRQDLATYLKGLKNNIYEVGVSELESLSLERKNERQTLCFYYGDEEVEIGDALTEPEREWIYEVIKEHIEGL